MLDYVVKVTELPKGFTLGDYVKLKGLTDKDWLLIYDENKKLLTGVRADELCPLTEAEYYIILVQHFIFPIYVSCSDRGYYIVVYISKTPIDVIPKVETLVEVSEVKEDTEDTSEMIDTNIGEMPIEDYKDIVAIQNGFNSYVEMRLEGLCLDVEKNINPSAEEKNKGIEFTPLEHVVFQTCADCLEKYYFHSELVRDIDCVEENQYEIDKNCHLANEQISKFLFLSEIISKSGLAKKQELWIKEQSKF